MPSPSSWRHFSEIPSVCFAPHNLRKTIPLALLVGTLLFLINQSQLVFSDTATFSTYARIVLTYLVPFLVANYGILVATRRSS